MSKSRIKEKCIKYKGSCRRLVEHNHIPVVIDQQSLDTAAELSGGNIRRAGILSGASFSGRLSGRMPERVGVGVVDGGSVPRRWVHSLRG